MKKSFDHFTIDPASFRDPAGFVFRRNGLLYRQVNLIYQNQYDFFISSGLYNSLMMQGKIVSHEETNENLTSTKEFYLTLKPELIPFISYPYEWCFSQLKEAALFTLDLQLKALEHGMSLKDATPYNIQFLKGYPILIDSLSFEIYKEAQPWVAYRQFCEMFLYPLMLEHYCKIEAIPLLKHFFHGIPASYTAALLPWKSTWNLGVRLHVMLQAKYKAVETQTSSTDISFNRQKMLHLVQHLRSVVHGLTASYPEKSIWNNYYVSTILGEDYLAAKKAIIESWIRERQWNQVIDLGANDGYFSRLLSPHANFVVATDFDAPCIERMFHSIRKEKLPNILPMVQDLSNPSPALGFANKERLSFVQRSEEGLVMALAVIHHLCITGSVSFEQLAAFFYDLGKELIVEFVPIEDEKVQLLLRSQSKVFDHYTQENFEAALSAFFTLKSKRKIEHSSRWLYQYMRS